MSVYSVECPACREVSQIKRSPKELPELKARGALCPACGQAQASYVFQPGGLQVNFAGGVWSDKNSREKSYRAARAETLGRRQKDNNWTPTLQPNFQGEQTDSWKEAQSMARSRGSVAPETYDNLVRTEGQPKP
jgi:hypothetical protein